MTTLTTLRVSTALTTILISGAALAPARAEIVIPIDVYSSRLYGGITGTSTSVITSDDIARSPAQSIAEIIAQTPGVQLQSLYGIGGAGTVVDIRGFGATATSNTLVLINGRRINDLDIAGVDFTTVPRDSIERIEITRGNSGGVLYGDNAIGGVINIITKTGASGGKPVAGRIEGGFGSYGWREGSASFTANTGPWSVAAFGNAIGSDGWRDNNRLRQYNGVGEIRYKTEDFSAFLNLSGDDQKLGLPGVRSNNYFIGNINQQLNPRGATTPLDYAGKQGLNATAGFTRMLWPGVELIVDGGVRDKKQQAGFFDDPQPANLFPFRQYVDTKLLTWSLTPRLNIKGNMFGVNSLILTGIDYYDAAYNSDRNQLKGLAPFHVYNLAQQSIAGYFQQTLNVLPTTDISYGARVQSTHVTARDTYNPLAPPPNLFYTSAQDAPLDQREIQPALHVGIEHRVTDWFAIFGRAARSFRTPNVDERVGAGPHFDQFFNSIPSNFALATQTSRDFEGGVRVSIPGFNFQSSIYDMRLRNEIHYNPFLGYNLNLDPTHRYGSETQVSMQANEWLKLRGGVAYTRAVFAEGPFAGNDIPLVSRWSGSGGFTWNAWQQYLVVDVTGRFWGPRHLDNDQRADPRNPLIPQNATVDVKMSGTYQQFFWSASANNIFNRWYYDYGIASQFTPGNFSIYPLPGRTYVLKAGMTF